MGTSRPWRWRGQNCIPWGRWGQQPRARGTSGTSRPWGHHGQQPRAVGTSGTSRPRGHRGRGDVMGRNCVPRGRRGYGDIMARSSVLWGHHGQLPRAMGTLGTSWPWGHHGQEHRAMMGTPRHPGDVTAMGTSRPGALPYGDTTRAMGTLGTWGHRGQERCAMGMGTSVPHHGDTSGPRPPSHSHRVTAMGTSEGRNPTTYHGGQQDHDPNATGTAGP